MNRTWNQDAATKRIKSAIAKLPTRDIEIHDYVRDKDLSNLPNSVSYRVNGVHLYADILNIDEMLNVTYFEGETCHKRTLRFLNLHYRAVHRIIQRVDSILVDFHNQRLHTIVVKPYDNEVKRIQRAVAMGQLIMNVLARTGEDEKHPAAKVRIGIDSGIALAVNNGRRGHREPLFLGEPANYAAKRSGGGAVVGIYLTNNARKTIGLGEVEKVDSTPLSTKEISACEAAANLDVTADQIVRDWQSDLDSNPIGDFQFSAHTPPFSTLDIEELSIKNARRQDAATIYADIDGFTAYVGRNVSTDDSAKHVVQALNIIRTELDNVLYADFAGRKVRFIGDCLHGVLVEGTAQNTDAKTTIKNATKCAAAMRSSFDLALTELKNAGTDAMSLGLSIGFDFGPIPITRLGIRGEKIRCAVSRAIISAENEQRKCSGTETAIGLMAYNNASAEVQNVFGKARRRGGLNYGVAVNEIDLLDKRGNVAKAAESTSLLRPATTASVPLTFPDRRTGPSKPAGYA